jgi:hypothetical protein
MVQADALYYGRQTVLGACDVMVTGLIGTIDIVGNNAEGCGPRPAGTDPGDTAGHARTQETVIGWIQKTHFGGSQNTGSRWMSRICLEILVGGFRALILNWIVILTFRERLRLQFRLDEENSNEKHCSQRIERTSLPPARGESTAS